MEILWPALGIAVIVVFVFYVLAQYWQRLLRQQNWTIRHLFERVQSLEELSDPEWRRKISEAAPVPLEQVFTFTFRLGDRFWRDAIRLSEDDQKFVREYGSFVGSIKLERWRSHAVATITEVLPDRKATGWQTRSLDFYSDPFKSGDAISLWELALARPGLSAARHRLNCFCGRIRSNCAAVCCLKRKTPPPTGADPRLKTATCSSFA